MAKLTDIRTILSLKDLLNTSELDEYGDIGAKPVVPITVPVEYPDDFNEDEDNDDINQLVRYKFADPISFKTKIKAGFERSTIPDLIKKYSR